MAWSQGLAAALRGLDAHPQGFFHALLAGVFVQGLRAQGAFGVLFFFEEVVGDDAVFHAGVGFRIGDGAGPFPGGERRPPPQGRFVTGVIGAW